MLSKTQMALGSISLTPGCLWAVRAQLHLKNPLGGLLGLPVERNLWCAWSNPPALAAVGSKNQDFISQNTRAVASRVVCISKYSIILLKWVPELGFGLLQVLLASARQPGAGEGRARPRHLEHHALLKQLFMDLGAFTGSPLRLILYLNTINLICTRTSPKGKS